MQEMPLMRDGVLDAWHISMHHTWATARIINSCRWHPTYDQRL